MQPFCPDPRSLFTVLDIIDGFVAKWQRSLGGLACRKGCSICCTAQLTVTEAEAARILPMVSPDALPKAFLENHVPSPWTTNEFAYSCLHGIGQEPDEFPEKPGECPFLSEAKECTVYPVRPLMCRLFISTAPCEGKGEATVPELAFFMQIVLQQLAEHLSRRTRWGNLATMLRYCSQTWADSQQDLRLCQEIPCFPLSPEEKKRLSPQLNPLFDQLKKGGWLPENFNLDFASTDIP